MPKLSRAVLERCLLLALVVLFAAGCTNLFASDAAPAFWAAASAAVAAIPLVGPVLAPVVATAGPALAALAGTHGTALVAGGALVQHKHFGLPFTSRRAHLADARAAHATAVKTIRTRTAASAAAAKAA